MRLPEFEYLAPKTLKEASRALALDPKGSVLLAGGTDLLVNMKHRLVQPRQVINLKSIRKMASLSKGPEGFRIGALTTLHDIAASPLLREQCPALCHAAEEVGAYPHQSMGTLGGNLCQENRCRFYNQSAFWRTARPLCYKAGGEICHVVRKPKECHSTYCGDMAPVLIALDAQVTLSGPQGERNLSLKRLYSQNGKKPLAFKKGELLKDVFVPSPSGQTLYLKWRMRDAIEFPVVSLALHIERQEGTISRARAVFSGVGPGPVEALEAGKMLRGCSPGDQLLEKVSHQAVKEISPMRTSLHSPAYKRKVAVILLRKALEEVLNETSNTKFQIILNNQK